MSEYRFGPGDPVWGRDAGRWGAVECGTDSAQVWLVVWDGERDAVPVHVGRLVAEADVVGVLR